MTLADYLNEMEYAVARVIESLWHEHDEAERLRREIDEYDTPHISDQRLR